MSKITEVVTGDGSITFHNSDVDETYHTKSGAIDEALRKHVLPSNVLDYVKKHDSVVIADVCFGLGYNSLVAISEIWKINPACKILLFAFENDYEILNQIPTLNLSEDLTKPFEAMKQLVDVSSIIDSEENIHYYSDDLFTMTLFVGDVVSYISKIEEDSLNVVFFDPFSPKKHPHLWDASFLKSVFQALKADGRLTTYSCARMVRDNLKEAGFFVTDGPSVGRRAPSTVAIKN